MRMLLVFVALFAVTGMAYAETKTECSNKAYFLFKGCIEVFEDLQAMNKESDLYELWEKEIIVEDTERCLVFRRKSEPRYQACIDRFIDEIAKQAVEKTIQEMDPKKRKKLEKSGPVTLPPHKGSDSPLHFATQLEAQRYVLELITRETLKDTLDVMQGVDKKGTTK